MDTETENTLKLILGLEQPSDNECRYSCLEMAIKEIEAILGSKLKDTSECSFVFRNITDFDDGLELAIGKNQEMELPDILTVLSLSFIVLDQLGHIFTKGSECVRISNLLKNSHLKNIREEYHLSKATIDSITQLRHCLNHNFGLASIQTHGKFNGKGRRKFSLNFNYADNTKIIDLQNSNYWKGWGDKSVDTSVIIYVFPMIIFVSKVLKTITDAVNNGKCTSVLSNEELKTRFTIISTK